MSISQLICNHRKMLWGQYNRIADRVLELGLFPEEFRLVDFTVDFESERSQGLRRMLVDNYSVFYIFKKDLATVTRVLYSASDIEKRLKAINFRLYFGCKKL